ncbi:MAG: hypothetical protein ACYS7M_15490, partial [Planctomycetota bacterium]
SQAPEIGQPTIVVQAHRSQGLLWVIAVCLVIIATCLVLQVQDRGTVNAQPVTQAGARGIFAFTGQLTKGTYGVFMVDVDAGTLWCYEYVSGKRTLRFVASRSWVYDRYLEEFNAGDPPVAEIERLVEEQRARKLQLMGSPP